MGAATQLSTGIAESHTATAIAGTTGAATTIATPFALPSLLEQPESQRSRRLQSKAWTRRPRLSGEKLERACRIALMEMEEPAPVEVIYDRIVKRGCLVFAGYKRPFRAITLAMASLVRRGEADCCLKQNNASVMRGGRTRYWFRANPWPQTDC
jgi:hypothetical protein